MFRAMWRRGQKRHSRAGKPGRTCRPVLEALEDRVVPSFAAPVSYNIGTQSSSNPGNVSADGVATGDFRNDGKLDLAVAHTADHTLNILLGNGDGTFQSAVSYATTGIDFGPIWVAVADFNGDGKLDVAVLGNKNNSTEEGVIDAFLGNGDGTFQSPVAYDAGPGSRGGIAVGDFNGDGKLDLAVADNLNDSSGLHSYVNILLGNGDGTFQSPYAVEVQQAARSVTAGDFNGDGKTDLAVADGQGYNGQLTTGDPAGVTVLLGNGDGTFTTGGQYDTPPTPGGGTVNPEFITAGDLRGNGKTDLVVSLYDHNIDVLLGNGDGTFQSAVGYDTWIDSHTRAGWYPRYAAIADVNGDGKMDLVVDNIGTSPNASPSWYGSIAVLQGNGDGTFQTPVQYTPFNYPGWLAVGDFNGDGSPDIAVTRIQDGHSVNVMLNQTDQPGDAGFETPDVGTGTWGSFQYDPSGSAWTFDNGSGVAGNGSGFTAGNPDAPEGTQVAFLQATGSFSQSVFFAAGTYTLNFFAAQRANYQYSSQTFQVLIDGTVVGTFTPSGTSYATYATDRFTVGAGNHVITFVGTDPDGQDNTAFLDQVGINLSAGV